MKRSEIAEAKFLEGYNCAQLVFYSFCDDLNFDKNTALSNYILVALVRAGR